MSVRCLKNRRKKTTTQPQSKSNGFLLMELMNFKVTWLYTV